MVASETIIIDPLSKLIPGATFLTEKIITSLSLNYSATGGSFSISVLQGSIALPPENTVLSLPFGRIGVVKQIGSGYSQGGLTDIISGPALPLSATQQSFAGVVVNLNDPNPLSQTIAVLANRLMGGVSWETLAPFMKSFAFRGIALSGVQQLASVVLGDVIVRNDGVHVVDPGAIVGNTPFQVTKSDIVSVNQITDYSLDVASILNPALTAVQFIDQGDFVYDSDHAQKQPKFTVQCGAPSGSGSSDHIDIPDGWLIDGAYEEWTPPPGTDFSNPASTATNGRYWKVFPSPTNPGKFRGITNFNKIVKEIKIPGNVSTFVGSPITGSTSHGGINDFLFEQPDFNGGIDGFQVGPVTMFDVITDKDLDIPNAIVLVPKGKSSGEAYNSFYAITMEIWTFPRVNPQSFGVGDPLNPFNIPRNVVVVTPNSNVQNSLSTGYYSKYLSNFRLINSPRLKTTVSIVYRNALPQVGDKLTILNGTRYSDCGRIQSTNLNFNRSGLLLNIQAEKYQFGPGLYGGQGGAGSEG